MEKGSSQWCERSECEVNETGVCLDGLPLEECPHYQGQPNDVSGDGQPTSSSNAEGSAGEDSAGVSEVSDLPEKEDGSGRELFSGDAIDSEEAHQVMSEGVAHLVVVVGPPGVGKTTLFASIWDLYQQAPFADYIFAGSRTQMAFERRCHHARTESGRQHPDTERTTRSSQIRLLHLCLGAEDLLGSRKNLLLADISGETFKAVRDSGEEARNLPVLRRADHILLLVDGERLLDPRSRNAAKANSLTTLRSCVEEDMVRSTASVKVAVSKWDLIESASPSENVERTVELLQREVRERFGEELGCKKIHKLAARPDPGSGLSLGYGVERLLKRWVEKSSFLTEQTWDSSLSIEPDREYGHFLKRNHEEVVGHNG